MIYGRQSFTFDGISSTSFGLWITGKETYNAPERDVTEVDIPGKDGSLVYDNGRYKNTELSYPVFITQGFRDKAAGIRSWLLPRSGNWYRLTDTYNTDEFRLARYAGGIEFDVKALHKASEAEFKFSCKPQRFLLSGETTEIFTETGIILNPTEFSSKPLIRVYGTGDLYIGSGAITISDMPGSYTDLDCEMQEAFCGVDSCNQNVVLQGNSFPVLSPGTNGIRWTGDITRVEITPRWWRI